MLMFPSSAFLVLCTPFAGWASDRVDHRAIMVLGYLCYAAFGAIMVFADLRFSALTILVVYFGRGLGLGFTYTVIYAVGISGFDALKGKRASTLLNLCIVLGGALAVSLLASILDQRQHVRQVLLAETQQLNAVGTQLALQKLEGVATAIGGSLPPSLHAKVLLSRLINREATMLAFNDAFSVFVLISLCGLFLVLFFRRARPLHRRE